MAYNYWQVLLQKDRDVQIDDELLAARFVVILQNFPQHGSWDLNNYLSPKA